MELLTFLLALAALILALRNSSGIGQFENRQRDLHLDFERILRRIDKLATDLNALKTQKAEAAPVASEPPRAAETPEFPDLARQPPVVLPVAAVPVEIPHSAAEVQADRPPTAAAVPRPAAAVPPRHPPPSASKKSSYDWEALIGVKLFSWIAGIALVIAAIFFLKYSVDHGWLSPAIRMAVGLLIGAALLVVCEWKAAQRYSITANALDAAGIAILFSTFFAAHALWNLIPPVPTFALMAMVTALAVLLSIRRDSLFIALLGLVGGFATPALLSTGEDRPIALFGYLLLLNAGLAWVAYRKRWPYLTLFSAIFITLYQWGWVLKFLHAGSIPLALSIFLVFPILNFAAAAIGEAPIPDKSSARFAGTSAISGAMPLLFALYLAAIPEYGSRYWLLFAFLFLIDSGLAVIAVRRGTEWLHAGAGGATIVTFILWLQMSYTAMAWPAVLGITAAFVLLYLGIGYRARLTDIGAGAY